VARQFKLTEENGQIKFTKVDFELKKDKGTPIIGWISKKRIGLWLNHLRDLNMNKNFFPVRERPKINDKHITLYLDGNLIGWVEKDCRSKVIESLWEYLKENGGASSIHEKGKYRVENDGQLKLF
jgi:hypothetical protein